MTDYDWMDGSTPPPVHEPYCEKFDQAQDGLLPCACSSAGIDPRWPLDPIIAQALGVEPDLGSWLECVDDHDPCCPGEHQPDACCCRLISRVRYDERARVMRWIARGRFPDIEVPGAANDRGDLSSVMDPTWPHGEVVTDRVRYAVICADCGAMASTVNQLYDIPCIEPAPVWDRYAA